MSPLWESCRESLKSQGSCYVPHGLLASPTAAGRSGHCDTRAGAWEGKGCRVPGQKLGIHQQGGKWGQSKLSKGPTKAWYIVRSGFLLKRGKSGYIYGDLNQREQVWRNGWVSKLCWKEDISVEAKVPWNG